MNKLRQKASEGAVVIHGRNTGHSPSVIEPIDADFWKRNKFEILPDPDNDILISTASSRKGTTGNGDGSYRDMSVSKKRVMELWPPSKNGGD
jgi:hypothetical protein